MKGPEQEMPAAVPGIWMASGWERSAYLILLCLLANAYLALLPMFVGTIIDRLAATPAQAGFVASIEFSAAILVPMIGVVVGARVSQRDYGLSGLLLMVVANLASGIVTSLPLFTLSRFASGCGGALVTIAFARGMAGLPRPGVVFGLAFAVQGCFGFVGYLAFGPIVAAAGLPGVFWLFAVLALLLLAGLRYLDPRRHGDDGPKAPPAPIGGRTLVIALALLVYFVFESGVWGFIERIGRAGDVPPSQIATALAASSIAGVAGSLAAAIWSQRLDPRRGLLVFICLQILGIWLLLTSPAAGRFLAAVLLIRSSSMAVAPLFMTWLAREGDGQRGATIGVLAISTALMLGPLAAPLVIHDGDYRGLVLAAFGGTALPLALTILLHPQMRLPGRLSPGLPGRR